MRMRYLIAFIFIFWGRVSVGQDFSNKGKEFWVGYGSHVAMYNGNGSVNTGGGGQDMVLYFTSDRNANVTVSIPSLGWTNTYPVVANAITTSARLPKTGAQDARITDEGKSGKGIHITSDVPIIAYAHIYNAAVSGATLLFPVNTLAREYYSVNYKQVSNQNNSYCFSYVIATEDNTNIEIIPSARTILNSAGDTIKVNLNKGEIYNILGKLNTASNPFLGEDLTGTKIRSVATPTSPCKRIAVFSGSGKLSISCNNGSGSADNYMQQAFPANAWGKKYLTVPTLRMPNNIYRIAISKPGTIVRRNGIPLTGLQNGFFYEYQSNTPDLLESNEQIMVAQYITTANTCGNTFIGGNGDPEMIYLSPIEQTIDNVTINSTPNSAINQHYINIAIHKEGISSLRIDGAPPVAVSIVHPEESNYSFYQVQVGAGSHTIKADSGFNAIAYGYGNAETYGYNAGANVKDLYQTLTTNNKFATVKLPATCKGTPFNISITLPYEPLSLEWKVPNFPAIPKDNAPKYDSTYLVNGKRIYSYSLKGTYVYNAINTYNIQVIANNPTTDGCSGEQQIDFDLQVFEPPKGGFKFTSTNCITDSIAFLDTTSSVGRPIIGYSWDMGDGNFSSSKNFKYKYKNPGKYTVKAFAYTDVGCLTDTIVQDIFVDSVPVANFSISGPACQNKDISFIDGSRVGGGSKIIKWLWVTNNPTSNSTNATVIEKFTGLQQYTVQLRVVTENGCMSPTKSLTFSNNPNPVVGFSLPKICLPDGVGVFNDLSSISDGSQAFFLRKWVFGDPNASSTNPDTALNRISTSHKYTAVGPYTVKLVVQSNNGCSDSLSQQLTQVFAQPKTDFTVTPEVCLRENTGFNDLTNPQGRTMTKWNWSLSNGLKDTLQNPVFTLLAAGTYTAKLIAFSADGCVSDSTVKSFIVHPLPIADFKVVDPACESETSSFAQLATANVGNLTRWNWRLGNADLPQNFTNANPVSKTFAVWGDQVIRLMVENSKGCKSDTVSKTIRIHPKPLVNNSIPEVCLNDAFADFYDSTTIADNTTGFRHLWRFGDANAIPSNPDSSILKDPKHKYTAAGTYSISHRVTSMAGCISTKSTSFIVSGAVPKSNFVVLLPDSLCSNDTVRIKNLSTVDFGFIGKLEVYWDYDNNPTMKDIDLVPDSGKIYKHVYPRFANQPLKPIRIVVRAFSGGSCFDDENRNVNVLGSPQVQMDILPGICLEAIPRQITQTRYTDVSGIAPGDSIFIGKGVSSKGLYSPMDAGAGTYRIQYIFTASNGCRDTVSKNIVVWPRPTADFVYSTLNCEKNPISFTNRAVANAGNLVSWNWNFGDGSVVQTLGNANPLNYTFAAFKTYNVSLDVITNNGCTSEPKILPVLVHPLPIVNFDLPKVCLPEGKALFINNSTIPDGSGSLITYLWNFGNPSNPNPSLSKDGTHNYLSLGSYAVKLVATSSNNCKDSLTRQLVDVFPQPKAVFNSLDSACLGTDIKFIDNSNGFVRPIAAWRWDFGNGVLDNQKDPTYMYRATGSFDVRLHVISNEGCVSDTALKSITIHPYPKVSAGTDMFVLDDGQKAIAATASGNALRFHWSPKTFLSDTSVLQPFVVKPQEDIVYTLSVTGRGNCTSTDDVAITVLKLPKPPNTFTPNGDGINDLWDIKYLDQYPGCILEVYSTQGQLIFRSQGYSKPWDGTYRGNPVPNGTYYFVIDPKSGRSKVAGYVTIFK